MSASSTAGFLSAQESLKERVLSLGLWRRCRVRAGDWFCPSGLRAALERLVNRT